MNKNEIAPKGQEENRTQSLDAGVKKLTHLENLLGRVTLQQFRKMLAKHQTADPSALEEIVADEFGFSPLRFWKIWKLLTGTNFRAGFYDPEDWHDCRSNQCVPKSLPIDTITARQVALVCCITGENPSDLMQQVLKDWLEDARDHHNIPEDRFAMLD